MKEGASARQWGVFEPRVLFEASGVVALEKPAGLPAQAPTGIASVESWLRRRLAGAGPAAAVYLGVPHRLDRAVSGVLLMAATPRAARKLSRQFERRQIGKTYVALISGEVAAAAVDALEQAGIAGVEWRDLIEKVPDEPRARVVMTAEGSAREAVTQARLLVRLDAGSVLVELRPVTGRMHQLRLQAAVRGMPVAGDRLYGKLESTAADWAAMEQPAGDPRALPIALHAWRIRYADPDTGREITLAAPLPAYWPAGARAVLSGLDAGGHAPCS
jgi:23S rRNA pseudouridine1911/1915/1917 synthase